MLHSTADDYQRYLALIPKELQDHWYAAVYNYQLTKKAKACLSDLNANNFKELALLMDEHQKILAERIKNTPVPMIKMMKSAKEAGATAVKTIGSGGGGCMLAMVTKETQEKVITAFKSAGAKDAYSITIVYP